MTEGNPDNIFGETMKAVRERAGLSKKAMARLLRNNWSRISSSGFLVSRWEDGRIVFSLISIPGATEQERDLLVSKARLTEHERGFILEIHKCFIQGKTYGELFGDSENNLA